MLKKIIKPSIYIILVLLFILADVMCDNSVFQSFSLQSPTQQLILFIGLLLLQTIAAPIQSGFSDFYCRKKSLVVSLFFSFVALLLQYLYSTKIIFYYPVLLLIGFLKGSLGNTTPMAWAAIADTKVKNIRFSFALATGSFAVAYLLLISFNKLLSPDQSILILAGLLFSLFILCIFLFWDMRDEDNSYSRSAHQVRSDKSTSKKWNLVVGEIKLILEDLISPHIRNALLAFLFFEISLYSILLLYVDFNVKEFSNTSIAMVLGYIFGVIVLRFCGKIKDDTMIRIGYNISAISLIPFFVSYFFTLSTSFGLLAVCYFFHMTGNAFLSSTLFSILANERKPHEQGRIYGLIASTDTIAFLLSSICVIIYNTINLNLIYITAFSFFTVAISWYPYAKFEKYRPKARRE